MSLIHSPSIVTDGLVLYYDMYNTKKSFKGKPTTNVSLMNGQDNTNPWMGDGTPTSLGMLSDITFRSKKVAKFQTGTSGNCYLNGAAKLSTGTLSTDWTSTFYIKRVDGVAIVSVSAYLYITNNANVNISVPAIAIEDGWYKVVYTRSGLVSGYPSLTGMYSLGASIQYYFADWQCEPSDISTPYVDGTRSTTQALLDLTGKNTLNTSSLTYAADNTFSFNGAGNFLTLPATIGYTDKVSVFAWFKSLGAPRGGYHILTGPQELELSIPTSGELRTGIFTNARFVSNHGSGLASGTWNYIGFTFDGVNKISYINGINVGTMAVTGSLTYNIPLRSVGILGVGAGTYGVNGSIGSMKIYSKALAASEVRQNFNATRSRYGI